MRFTWTDGVVILLLAAQAGLAAIIAGDPETFGIPRQAIAWAAVVNVVAGVVLNQLKSLGQPPSSTRTDPAKTITP